MGVNDLSKFANPKANLTCLYTYTHQVIIYVVYNSLTPFFDRCQSVNF
nr:MAG TPA: hypothetical protein [Caudoviricetes sp.]DAW27148.1 MAG TPA: hypothetical protein [Caudoviricetes sp.]